MLTAGVVLVGAGAGPLRPRGSSSSTAIAAPAVAAGVGPGRAVAAYRFSDAVGICTHPNWQRTLWGSTDWQSALFETGVHHIRGKIGRGRPARTALAGLQRLFANGVKICVTVASEDGEFDLADTQSNIDFLADRVGAQHISGIESANEYNNPRKRPADWAPRLRDFQAWLYQTVKSNPRLASVPVVGPSIWGRLTNDYLELGSLQPNVDKACLHYYTGGRRPTRAGRPSGGGEGGGSDDYGIGDAIREASLIAPSRPVWITEYGYPVAGPGTPPSPHMITETAAAKYLLRGLLDAFALGVEKIYIYSLIDDVQRSPPRYHGLLDGSLRRRPAFHAVRNLMALFADRGAAFTPGALDYSLGNAAGAVKQQLFQKSDGTFLLSMYQDVDSYDRSSRRDKAVRSVPVRLGLARAASRIEIFTPSISPAPIHSASNASGVMVPVGDQVTVVKIFPR
jgi:hypothetical protein